MNRRRGFTLIELCLAMMITAMVATALTTFAFSMTGYWHETEQRQQLQVSLAQSRSMVAPIFESARGIGCVAVGASPGVFLWQEDTLGDSADQKSQFAEMALVQYDSQTQTIYYYQANKLLNLVGSLTASAELSAADIANPNFIALFKQQNWLLSRRALIGPGREMDSDIAIARVENCVFSEITSGGLPAIQMNATVSRGQERRTLTEVFTVRAPTVQ